MCVSTIVHVVCWERARAQLMCVSVIFYVVCLGVGYLSDILLKSALPYT